LFETNVYRIKEFQESVGADYRSLNADLRK